MLVAGVPGEVVVVNSTIQILRSNFSLNSGGTAGALAIDSSRVLIDSTTFANNTGAAAAAIQVSAALCKIVKVDVHPPVHVESWKCLS